MMDRARGAGVSGVGLAATAVRDGSAAVEAGGVAGVPAIPCGKEGGLP